MNAIMNDETKAQVEAAGFKVDKAGKVRNSEGHLVTQAVAEAVAAGMIVTGFNPDELRKKKNRASASSTGSSDLVAALHKISPAIELLQVGQTAKIAMPKTAADGKDPKRSFVMSVVTKLNNVTALGREWAGRRFDSLSDEEGNYFYVTRLEDGEAKARKPGGGRRKANSMDALAKADAAIKEKLGETAESSDETPAGEVTEEATVVRH